MIEEAYVSLETAKLLKEKGFNQELDWVYSDKFGEIDLHYGVNEDGYGTTNDYKDKNFICIAPTQQMAMRWLREVHHIHIRLINSSDESYRYEIYPREGKYRSSCFSDRRYYETYEEAAEAAIKYCLENMIDK